MLGIGKKNFGSSMAPVYLFLFILITNEFLLIHSYVFMRNDRDQNRLANSQLDAIHDLAVKYLTAPEEENSSSNEQDFRVLFQPTVQRRFCCMSPLGGRKKRFIRDLARKQQPSNVLPQ